MLSQTFPVEGNLVPCQFLSQMAKEVTVNELAGFILSVLLVSLAVLPPHASSGLSEGKWNQRRQPMSAAET